jgi:probable HAF family extracellular repeat protein
MSLEALPVSVADLLQLQQGIEFFTDPAEATTEAASINAGTQTVAGYANQLILKDQALSQVVMAADSLMFGAVDTEQEMTTLTTQFVPAQLAFFNSLPPATQTGAGGPIVWDAEVTGFALSGPNGNNNPVTKGNFAANLASLNTGANAGDAGNTAFADAVSTAIFGNLSETNQVLSFLTSFISFFTANPSALNGASLLQGADGITFGAEVGIALANPTTVGAFLEGLVSNALIDNAEGILEPGVALGLQPQPTPLQGGLSSYTFTTLSDPLAGIDPTTGLSTGALSINNANQVVGTYEDHNAVSHGFLYTNGTFTTLTDPLANSTVSDTNGTQATAINSSGQVIGNYYDADSTQHGFLFSNGTFTDLTDPLASPSGVGTIPASINASAQIVGDYYDANGIQHGFLYNNGSFTTLTDPSASATMDSGAVSINDSGQVVGTYNDANGVEHGYLFSNETFTTLTDPLAGTVVVNGNVSTGTIAVAINASGKIIGDYIDSSGTMHGFLFTNGTFTTITDPAAGVGIAGAGGTFAYSINVSGQIVGFYTDSSGVTHGFLFSNGTYTDITDPSAGDKPLPGGGSTAPLKGTVADSINDVGQIVGFYTDSNGNSQGFLASPSALLSSHPTASPLPGAASASIATTASHVEVTGIITHLDHTGM